MLDFGFYNLDCMEGMKEFPDNYFDLAIVDPPYGINIGNSDRIFNAYVSVGGVGPFGGKKADDHRRREYQYPKKYKAFDDSSTPDAAYFTELERVAKTRIIWGGNYFLEYLGATECLIVWDKRRRGLNFADCEIAWTNIKQPCRIYEFKWNGMLQEDMKNKEFRIHPTQKPVQLYKWLLNNYAKDGDIILDTHVGSASSLIACRETGHKYVGFEIDPDYYAMAKERLDAAEAQVNIFDLMKGD